MENLQVHVHHMDISKLKEETENKEINRAVLINLIDKIIVFDDGSIKINYKNQEVKLMNNEKEKLPKVAINWVRWILAKPPSKH